MGRNGATLQDAQFNYHGTTDIATIGASVGANLDYSPMLGGGTYTSPGFTGDYSNLLVDANSPQFGGGGGNWNCVEGCPTTKPTAGGQCTSGGGNPLSCDYGSQGNCYCIQGQWACT